MSERLRVWARMSVARAGVRAGGRVLCMYLICREGNSGCVPYSLLLYHRRVPVEGKSSMCLICMKYNYSIIILIIIIISLGKMLLSYIAIHITHVRMHARAHTLTLAKRTPPPPPTTVAVRCVGALAPSFSTAGETMADRRLIEINNARATRYSR